MSRTRLFINFLFGQAAGTGRGRWPPSSEMVQDVPLKASHAPHVHFEPTAGAEIDVFTSGTNDWVTQSVNLPRSFTILSCQPSGSRVAIRSGWARAERTGLEERSEVAERSGQAGSDFAELEEEFACD